MNKRLAAGALAAVSTAAVLGLPATSASAATSSCAYPVSGAYTVTRTPLSITVRYNTLVYTRGNVYKGGTGCSNLSLGFYTKPANRADFRVTRSGVTDGTGALHVAIRPKLTTRFYYHITLNSTTGVGSAISEIIVKK